MPIAPPPRSPNGAPPQRCRSGPCATACRRAAGRAGVQRGRRRARPAGRRKKCFKLPLRCFKLPLRDAIAVVDSELRVHGIAGLCVADAAIMPTVVSGNTNAATIMIGERVADLVHEPLRLAA